MAISLEKIKKIPDAPGVYFFKSSRGKILYIGKAASLRDRVRSYLRGDAAFSRSPAISRMVEDAKRVDFKKTDSVLEAVILEAALIKKHQPKYNVREKDNKSFNYVVITDEDFPRVFTIRERELATGKMRAKVRPLQLKRSDLYGPFPQAGVLREALSIIRKIFPFRDEKCKMSVGKPCFNRQIGLCPGVCTGEISRHDYQKTVRNIKLLFGGKKKTLLQKLSLEMKTAARKQDFEKAIGLRNTIFALQHIQDVSLIKRSSATSLGANKRGSRTIHRIEAYDVAHTSGKETVGVMVVIEEGEQKKSAYRKFRVRGKALGSDTAALREVLDRRLTHPEWPFPDLVVVDGGKAQVNTARLVLDTAGMEHVAVLGVVKDARHHPKRMEGSVREVGGNEELILLANSEAHRFALSFHRKRRSALR